ncbi:hypothetical protein RND81_03G241400 [Saponaria officinalis]|uniref:TRAFD1/XAF1 zinc finger domain-containing protein n=1 Tax=Saponaria officinalis TaxID=3572 RepID=A0AAW1M2L7_SAPOF
MAMVSEETCTICGHCNRPIPSANIDLHFVHCSRNLEKCKLCGEMVPTKHAEDHYLNIHAPVACSLCTETMERDILDMHKGERCPQRIITCEFCEFPLPAIDLVEHQEVCGNRTERCHRCSRYIRLRDNYVHETTCNGVVEGIVGSSRDGRTAAERPARPERRAGPPFLRRHLLFSIAITGIALILGSLIFQKKPDSTSGR